MIDRLIRFAKRIALLLPGLAAAYFVATDVYPVLNRRVPAPLAVIVAYIFLAYLLIPALMRVIRFFIKSIHIPLFCLTADGLIADPVNIGLIGTREQVVRAMAAAGWYTADKRNIKSIMRVIVSVVLGKSYFTAPFSNLYLFGRHQDLGFQLPVGDNIHSRHHVRFWAAAPSLSPAERVHLDFWQRNLPNQSSDKQQLWVGTASLDTGLGFILHNAQLTHIVHPDTTAERELIFNMLKKVGHVTKKKVVKIGTTYRLRDRIFRAHLKTDGTVLILTLK